MLNEFTQLTHRSRQRHFATVSVVWTIAIVWGLSSAYAAVDSVIWERGDQIVQLVKQDDKSAPPSDHPMSMTADEIEAMLKNLRLRYVDEDSDVAPMSVFTQEEVENLGKAVATGLQRATPSQDIIFHVIGARRLSPGAFAKRNRVSAGRIFYRDGYLNVIFGQIQTPYRKKNVYGRVDEDFYPRNYGSRTSVAIHKVALLTNSAARLYQSADGAREDWIVIERKIAVGSLADAKPDPVPVPSHASSAAVEHAEAAPAIPAPSPAAQNKNDTATRHSEGMNGQPGTAAADVEERLKSLKRLRERDLISEDAYQTKMKEILQDL